MEAALDRFVLPEDVVITPVAELPEDVREGFAHESDDCAVTRPLARGTSSVVDARAAGLLERFRTPATIVEAVIAYSTEEGLDPHETLDSAFEMLRGFVAEGLLLAADSELAQPISTSLPPGELVGGFEVVEPAHVIADTEVHLARAEDGTAVALKIARAGFERRLAVAFNREAAVLEHLDGRVGPRLLAADAHEGRPFLAIDWCPGVDVLHAANGARALGDAAGRAELLRLAEETLAAYAQLHELGVAHGDVHPRNALAEPAGTVRLIDFGLAVEPAPPGTPGVGIRGGIDFFLDPETAAARLAGEMAPALSLASEQYSIAALLYLMLTGAHTQEFSLEPEEMLRQLVEREPDPFERHGVELPAVEPVVRRGLEKDPAERHDSVAEFRRAFAEAKAERERPAPARRPSRRQGAALLEDVLERLAAPDGELYAEGIEAPTASVMNGAAGFAQALLRIAGIRGDESLLALADLWAVRARLAAGSEEAFWNEELEIVPEVFGENSFFHNLAGVECVLGLVAAARGDEPALSLARDGFVAAARRPCEHVDVAFGKAGLLLGAAQLLETLPPHLDSAELRAAGDEVRDRLWAELEPQRPLAEGPELRSLGAAHGWAGYLYGLLRWSEAADGEPPPGLSRRLDELGDLALPAGRGLRWSYDAAQPMPHGGLEASWCNGAAGYVALWLAAHRLLGEERFEDWARRAAWTAYESPIPSGGDLCCGFGGRAYAVLALYRHGGEEVWLARARPLAERAAVNIRANALRRDSLYKGEVGVALLAAELERPEHASMPLFERE
ncbi:MAG TPA: lanthionine synthetase LanC family protein [Solirubrobacterales bacterium]|nr:lanthionine synthetase LanC family protein [Solirubrobacterales bacterium]